MSTERIDPEDKSYQLYEQRHPKHILNKVNTLDKDTRTNLVQLSVPRIVEPYIPHIPHPTQQLFLCLNNVNEVMFGGSAGGGKSDALLMSALQYVDVPGYSALILRRTWPDLNAPGAILDRAKTWLSGTDAVSREGGRTWIFPSGARLQFGYIARPNLVTKFMSAEYQFVGFDELTHFEEQTYRFMFSRMRKPQVNCINCQTALSYAGVDKKGEKVWKHSSIEGKTRCRSSFPDPKIIAAFPPSKKDGTTIFDVPIRMRAATNPGSLGHLWVKNRFIDPKTREKEAVYIPSRLWDNPSLNQEEYTKNLMHLSPIDRERMLNGDWDIDQEGTMFERGWFDVIDRPFAEIEESVRFWDLAATVTDASDWTVGAKMSRTKGGFWTIDSIVRMQGKPHQVEQVIRQTAMADGVRTNIRMEQEPGSAGVNNISHYRRNILAGFDFKGVSSTGSKEERAKGLSSMAANGYIKMVAGRWNLGFLDEISLFPIVEHDDQVDAVAGAFNQLVFGKSGRLLV